MCVNYQTVTPNQLKEHFNAPLAHGTEWKSDIWQDYAAPVIVGDQQGRQSLLGQYSMIPKKQIPPGAKRYSTMNARAETIATLRSYAKPWRDGQLCLVPMMAYYEPNYESGKAQRWRIAMVDDAPFAVAGLFRSWVEPEGMTSYSFTQITINADSHPVMKRFHKPGDEKRSLVVVAPERYDDWLTCRNPEQAFSFLTPCPPELFKVQEALKAPTKSTQRPVMVNSELF
ncbi:MAG: SOS response-associated peptidase [Burkholderiales bacterium]